MAQGHDDDLDLRPPRDPGRGVGRVPEAGRRAAAGRGRLLRRRVFGALGVEIGRVESADRRSRRDRRRAGARPRPPPRPRTSPDEALLQAVQAATSVVKAHRMHGHLAARLDPLGSAPRGDPALDPETVDLTAGADGAHPGLGAARGGAGRDLRRRAAPPARDLHAARSPTRSSTSPATTGACGCARRSSRASTASRSSRRRSAALLERLSEVEALEGYLHKAFLGKKQFSIEGLDVLVPMLDETIELGAGERRPRGGARHGPPRPPERAGPHRRPPVRVDPRGVRGRADPVGRHRRARGRHRRREVPLRRRRAPTETTRRQGRDGRRCRRTRATSST